MISNLADQRTARTHRKVKGAAVGAGAGCPLSIVLAGFVMEALPQGMQSDEMQLAVMTLITGAITAFSAWLAGYRTRARIDDL